MTSLKPVSMIIFLTIQLFLSEIMYNPNGSEFDNEFIEIYNASEHPIDLISYSVSDSKASDALILFSGDGFIAAGSYALVLDASYFGNSNQYEHLIPSGISIFMSENNTLGSGGLSNSSAETVLLLDDSAMIVDSVTYQAGYPGGFSFERQFEFGSDWGQSLLENGTPGFKNSIDRYIEKIVIKGNFNQFKSFNWHLFNSGDEFREEMFNIKLEYFQLNLNNQFEKQSDQSSQQFLSIDPGDSLKIIQNLNYQQDSHYKIRIEIDNSEAIRLKDSIDFIYANSSYPFIVDFIRL